MGTLDGLLAAWGAPPLPHGDTLATYDADDDPRPDAAPDCDARERQTMALLLAICYERKYRGDPLTDDLTPEQTALAVLLAATGGSPPAGSRMMAMHIYDAWLDARAPRALYAESNWRNPSSGTIYVDRPLDVRFLIRRPTARTCVLVSPDAMEFNHADSARWVALDGRRPRGTDDEIARLPITCHGLLAEAEVPLAIRRRIAVMLDDGWVLLTWAPQPL